jgi:uncharacterized protein (TIGR02147 family)
MTEAGEQSDMELSIFDYLDYRDFLRDHYELSKKCRKYFSYRYVGIKTGIDPSFYAKVLQKQMHIAERSLPKLVAFLEFPAREADFFHTLVKFNKAKSRDQIKHYFRLLVTLRDPLVSPVSKDHEHLFDAWYVVAVRELLNFFPFDGNFARLGRMLNPPLKASDAVLAIDLLERMGMIQRLESGAYELVEKFVTSGKAPPRTKVREFQRQMMQLGIEAIDRIKREERDISTITVSASRACFELMRERLAEVRRELLEMARAENSAEEVYQINLQLFPLTSCRDKKV